jgi:hypothetical protein
MAPFFRHKKVIDRPRVFCYILRLRFHPKEHPLIGRNSSHGPVAVAGLRLLESIPGDR